MYILYILYYIGDEATSLIFFLRDFHCYRRDTVFFNFPPTPLLSTLYNLAPMMKCISGKRELIPAYTYYCKIFFFF